MLSQLLFKPPLKAAFLLSHLDSPIANLRAYAQNYQTQDEKRHSQPTPIY